MNKELEEFFAMRADWYAKGMPADHPYARQCAETASKASGPAIGVRIGERIQTIEV